MKFVKSYNNNAALVKDDENKEWIVTGKGISFGKKVDDDIDDAKIERRFASEDSQKVEPEVVQGIEPRAFEAVDAVVKMADEKYQITFTGYQYFSLADHIDFMIKRTLDGATIPKTTGNWEAKKLFSKEYSAASDAVTIIEKSTHLSLDTGEALYLMYHFINAESDGAKLQDTVRMSKYITGIVNIIQYQYAMTLDPDSFNYERFIAHLRALMVRHITGVKPSEELDPSLLKLMEAKYPKEKDTVDRISKYLDHETSWILSPDDRVYLILHIWRVTHRENN